jgi:hypothetical protein
MRRLLAWWALFFVGVLLIVMGLQGSLGRTLAVLVAPGRLQVQGE